MDLVKPLGNSEADGGDESFSRDAQEFLGRFVRGQISALSLLELGFTCSMVKQALFLGLTGMVVLAVRILKNKHDPFGLAPLSKWRNLLAQIARFWLVTHVKTYERVALVVSRL